MSTPAEGAAPAAAPAATTETPGVETPQTPTTETQTPATPAAPTVESTAQVPGDEGGDGGLESSTDESGVVTYAPTGDAGMDMALAFAGNLGLGLDDPAMAATANGDWSLLEAKLATMGDKAKGYEAMIALAKEADARITTANNERVATINTAIDGVLGEGKEAILAWAGEQATAEEKASINAMLRADPVQARAAAMLLASLYEQGGGTTVTPAKATTDNAGGRNPAVGDTSPISKAQFAIEAGKLNRQFGPSYAQTPQYAALAARVR